VSTAASTETELPPGMKAPGKPDLDSPEWYWNRELTLLDFNRRVLLQAQDSDHPLLERLRFLTICSSNLDEFFEVRFAGLKQLVQAGTPRLEADGLSARELEQRISAAAHDLVDEQYRILNDELLPALAEENIRVLRRGVWTPEQQTWARTYFRDQVLPVLSPVALDPGHPFPSILNKSLNFVVALEGKDAFGRQAGIAIVQVPRPLPRLIRVPADLAVGDEFVMLSALIHAHVDALFPGIRVKGTYQFRITRNSDLWVDEEESEDLMAALQGELGSRRYGDAVRLEVADNCPEAAARFLLRKEGLEDSDLYQVKGPVNLHRLMTLCDVVERADLKFPPFLPGNPIPSYGDEPIFDTLAARDVLLHHPYESFGPVIELLQEAAADPEVLAIKATLYRTGARSPIVNSLVEAAAMGKQVTVLVELRARFDEAANISLANRLAAAGANVVYGVIGYKAHAKMLLVVRREEGRLKRYAHLGTGNYHAGNARLYTDFSYMTADAAVCRDVHEVFMQLTGVGQAADLERLLQSPFTLQPTLLKLIEQEAIAAKEGKPARILARMNSLADKKIIKALYKASRAGVEIDLIVRGVCCLRAGVPGVSENIRVRSLIGRFLEHSRVYLFHAGGQNRLYLASADWMPRNLYRRVEVAFPVDEPALKKRIIDEALDGCLQDNSQAWEQQPDGTWVRCDPGKKKPRPLQKRLLSKLASLS
jgi:polyphosphate kinase